MPRTFRNLVRKSNRNGRRKESRDDIATSRTGITVALLATKLCFDAARLRAPYVAGRTDGIERTERLPTAFRQSLLWNRTRRDEMRVQQRISARHFVPVSYNATSVWSRTARGCASRRHSMLVCWTFSTVAA